MQDQFNQVSLAKLSRVDLLALLANLQSQFSAASGEADQVSLRSKIEAVKRALAL